MHSIAIVGRPNVGKSALFNRLAGKRIAIVDPTYGLTRDRIMRTLSCNGRTFNLIDTGGIDFSDCTTVAALVRRQAEIAIAQAQIILFVTDVEEGLVPLDEDISLMLRKAGKEVLLVANKADNESRALKGAEFHRLGFGEFHIVSVAHDIGITGLIEAITERIPPGEEEGEGDEIRIAVVGKPNVGKSSFVNRVLCEERLIVDDMPGTTRDAVDSRCQWKEHDLVLIDTAGIRRKKSLKEAAEVFSLFRTRSAIRRCQAALLLIDAEAGVTRQDEIIARMIMDNGKGTVLAVNKWDLVRDLSRREYEQYLRRDMPFMSFAPLLFISAIRGEGIDKTLETLLFVAAQAERRIATPLLNDVLHSIWQHNQPPVRKKKRPKLYYATQASTAPPTFVLFVNNSRLIEKNYLSYLSNSLRAAFGFEGAPLRIFLRNRRK